MNKTTAAVVAGVTLFVAGCGASVAEAPPVTSEAPPVTSEGPVAAEDGQVITETVAAPSLANNLLGDPAEREILVFLPPSYEVTDERYPVVYYLAGYSRHIGTFQAAKNDNWEQMLAEEIGRAHV